MAEFQQYVDFNLNRQQLLQARIENLASAPSSPSEGRIYYDTIDDTLKYWDGVIWRKMGVFTGYLQGAFAASGDVNNPTPTILNLGSVEFDNLGLTVGANSITGFEVGRYRVTLQLGFDNISGARLNVEMQISVNSIIQKRRYGSNYSRRSGGHIESGDSMTAYVDIANTTDTLQFSTLEIGNGGTYNLDLGGSWYIIEKISI